MIFHLLTAVLFVLKVMDQVDISWWIVLAPSLIVFTIGLIFAVGAGVLAVLVRR